MVDAIAGTGPGPTTRVTPTAGRPLRIGILGAARIADEGIIEPARLLGHDVVAVAARDRDRAAVFAAERGIATVHDSYADLVADPQVDLVYDALVNSLHTTWNVAALQAGRHVLSEKPMAGSAAEARLVRTAAERSRGRIVEGFHYLYHPVNVALRELVVAGDLGEVRRVELVLATPAPPSSDPRWSLELGGGATMDLGCYVLSAARHVGRWLGQSLEVVSAQAAVRSPGLDARMQVELAYSDGVPCSARWDMTAQERSMTWTVVGSTATATSPAFAVPSLDPRLLITRHGKVVERQLGGESSYTYQLADVARSLTDGSPFLVDVDDAVANAELIDACYLASGLRPRESDQVAAAGPRPGGP